MARNLRAITDNELKALNELYDIKAAGDLIIVNSIQEKYSRRTVHDVSSFSILTPIGRRITFSNEAIELWLNKFGQEYTLLDVQAAVNKLIITYQEPSIDNVEKELKQIKERL